MQVTTMMLTIAIFRISTNEHNALHFCLFCVSTTRARDDAMEEGQVGIYRICFFRSVVTLCYKGQRVTNGQTE